MTRRSAMQSGTRGGHALARHVTFKLTGQCAQQQSQCPSQPSAVAVTHPAADVWQQSAARRLHWAAAALRFNCFSVNDCRANQQPPHQQHD